MISRLPWWLSGKECNAGSKACNAGDLSSVPGLGISPGEGNVNPLQYSCLENPIDKRSLMDYSPWGCKELDTTEQLSRQQGITFIQEVKIFIHARTISLKANNVFQVKIYYFNIAVYCEMKYYLFNMIVSENNCVVQKQVVLKKIIIHSWIQMF